MLNRLSGIAILVITELLLFSAWLSASPRSWLNYLWAALAILLWSQPWIRSDPYRTISTKSRLMIYIGLVLEGFVSIFIFSSYVPLLIILEVVILYLVDITGQRAISKKSYKP